MNQKFEQIDIRQRNIEEKLDEILKIVSVSRPDPFLVDHDTVTQPELVPLRNTDAQKKDDDIIEENTFEPDQITETTAQNVTQHNMDHISIII